METPLDHPGSMRDPNENLDVVQMNLDESLDAVRKAAYWFFGIAALSIVNTLLSSKGMFFVMGLGMSQIIDGIMLALTGDTNFFISLLAPAMFVVIGIFATKCHRWAFIVGGIVYLLDSALYLFFGEVFAFAFHLFILYKLLKGFQTISEFEELKAKLG